MIEKKWFVVFATREIEMEAHIYADSMEEAREMAKERADVQWESTQQDDTIWEVREEVVS